LESQHIIVKTLETNYRSVQGIAGATLLEDGSVSLVLDVSGLEEMLFRNSLNGGACYEGK
jgi:two-component system chemotaxis sensor kinase CheA